MVHRRTLVPTKIFRTSGPVLSGAAAACLPGAWAESPQAPASDTRMIRDIRAPLIETEATRVRHTPRIVDHGEHRRTYLTRDGTVGEPVRHNSQ